MENTSFSFKLTSLNIGSSDLARWAEMDTDELSLEEETKKRITTWTQWEENCRNHNLLDQFGLSLLEIMTGWQHWGVEVLSVYNW